MLEMISQAGLMELACAGSRLIASIKLDNDHKGIKALFLFLS